MDYDAPTTYAKLIAPRYAPVADALIEAAALRPKDDVLELGAGTGLVTKRAAPLVRSLLATDLSPGMLQAARKSIRRTPGLAFALLDYGAALPFLDASFDVVLSGLTYVQNSPRALKEITRVLKPNGRLAIAMWGSTYHEYRLLSDALESVGRGRFPAPAPGRAVRRLERAGFRSIRRSDIELTNRFENVEDYIAYRRGFGIPLTWTRAAYDRFLRAVHREASRETDENGRFTLGWTLAIIVARRAR
jgi:ubiquinone/menaquinone biosynthesis C-methylase UbiE